MSKECLAVPDPLLTTMQLGRLLQSARKARNLTQAALGERIGLSQKRISALERDPASTPRAGMRQLPTRINAAYS
jgi:DNA-binding XRE family transcriptional regulator